MTIRSVSLLAAVALAGLAAPALAQQGPYGPPPPLPMPAPAAVAEDWDDGDWEEEDAYEGDYDEREWSEHHPAGVAEPQPLAYSPEQRAEWLEQCHATYFDNRGEERGQVIGGVLGAVAGGVAGNRIAERGDRLAGTLIGGGVGALAGAAVGGAVGAEADRDRIDECEAYLVQYEHGFEGNGPAYAGAAYARGPAHAGPPHGAYAAPPGYGYAYPYPYPVVWVKVPIITRHRCGCDEVVEEEVVERSAPAPAPRRTKYTRVRSVK
jgi:hypothetical protein